MPNRTLLPAIPSTEIRISPWPITISSPALRLSTSMASTPFQDFTFRSRFLRFGGCWIRLLPLPQRAVLGVLARIGPGTAGPPFGLLPSLQGPCHAPPQTLGGHGHRFLHVVGAGHTRHVVQRL